MSDTMWDIIAGGAVVLWAALCACWCANDHADGEIRWAALQQHSHAVYCAWRAYPADAERRHAFCVRNKMEF